MRKYDPFVICFSEKGNLLSQWRAYCPKDGYALGFQPDDLNPLWLKEETTFAKCIYEKSEREEVIQAIAASLIEDFSDVRITDSEWMSKASGPSIWKPVHYAALIKDEHFHEEREWRFIAANPLTREIQYRQGRFGLTPYLIFPLRSRVRPTDLSRTKRLVCSTLMVGPRADEEASLNAAVNFAAAKLYEVEVPAVDYCRIPFRQ